MTDRILYIVTCGAPLASRTADGITASRNRGWQPFVIPTDASRRWIDVDALDAPVLSDHRAAEDDERAPAPDAVAVVPATFNTLNAWANGNANTYPLVKLCAALGARIPTVAVPFAKHDLAGHPAWLASIAVLRYAGVRVIDPKSGAIGYVEPVESGTGEALTAAFSWAWVLDQLSFYLRSAVDQELRPLPEASRPDGVSEQRPPPAGSRKRSQPGALGGGSYGVGSSLSPRLACGVSTPPRAGSKSEAAFLRLFSAGKLVPVEITAEDYERMAELVELYDDWPLGGTDASLIAVAERLGVTKAVWGSPPRRGSAPAAAMLALLTGARPTPPWRRPASIRAMTIPRLHGSRATDHAAADVKLKLAEADHCPRSAGERPLHITQHSTAQQWTLPNPALIDQAAGSAGRRRVSSLRCGPRRCQYARMSVEWPDRRADVCRRCHRALG